MNLHSGKADISVVKVGVLETKWEASDGCTGKQEGRMELTRVFTFPPLLSEQGRPHSRLS